MDKADFFSWCHARGLTRNNDISRIFRLSSQTVRNWSRKEPEDLIPSWVALACLALDTNKQRENAVTAIPMMTVSELAVWQRKHGFKTYDDTAGVFDIKRQAVHNWHKRGRFPRWLSLACAGYDIKNAKRRAKENSVAA